MNSKDILADFVASVKKDKSLSKYLTDISDRYEAEEIVAIYNNKIEFYFNPFIPITEGKLNNGGRFKINNIYDYLNVNKDGYIINILKNVPVTIITPSKYKYDEQYGNIEKNGKDVYYDIKDLINKTRKTAEDKKIEKEIKETLELAHEEMLKIEKAHNAVTSMRINYGENMHAYSIKKPMKKQVSPFSLNIRNMF